MKNIRFAMVAMCCLVLASCGKSKDAILTPETTNLRGDLKEYFTVVDKQYTVKYDDENFGGKYMISIELQRTDVPFAFDTKGLEPVGTFGQGVRGNYGIGIDIMDADGNIALSWSPTADGLSGVYSNDDLENLFTLESGETGRVRWTTSDFEKYDNKNFTFKVSSSLSVKECSAKDFVEDQSGEAYWTGKIDGKYAVHMSLWWDDDNLFGAYYYDKTANGLKNYLTLTGEATGKHIVMAEQNSKGMVTGYFDGNINGNVYQGDFIRAKDGKRMSFSLNYVTCENDGSFVAPFEMEGKASSYTSSSSYDDDDNSRSGSNDWDKILDDYEKYMDQYVKVMKKAQNGDMTALAEQAELLEKCQELCEEIEDAKDELTTAQATRFNKITMKAAGKLQ
jgi:hypothetical protein